MLKLSDGSFIRIDKVVGLVKVPAEKAKKAEYKTVGKEVRLVSAATKAVKEYWVAYVGPHHFKLSVADADAVLDLLDLLGCN